VTGVTYGREHNDDTHLRILADHGRSLTFLIADGVLPSNEERGYVLRRVMRRAIRHARLLGYEKPVLETLVDATVELMGDFYSEVRDRRDFIMEVANREEERFSTTLRQGLTLLETEIAKTEGANAAALPGDVAFRLHDTFGFPIDLTIEIATENGLNVDLSRFEDLMTAQRRRAREARRSGEVQREGSEAEALLEQHGPTEFLGYEHLTAPARVVAIASGADPAEVAGEGDEVDLVLDRTVFYAEGGGQVGDRGVIRAPSGIADVVDTHRLAPGLTGHRVKIRSGEIAVGDEVTADVDAPWRRGSERAHTATHILHWILRDRLGEHAHQAGSLVEPGRLRFDFHHFDSLSRTQVDDIGSELAERVLFDDPVRAYETSYDFARSIGAMAIFGEKYGDFVRVVEVGDYSKELCGGTHVPHTTGIGVVVVTSESSIAANVRRVEALVGNEGLRFLQNRVLVLERAAEALKTTPDEVADRVERLLATQKNMERRIAEIERADAEREARSLVDSAIDVDGARLVVARRDIGVDSLRALAQSLKSKLASAVVVLGTTGEGKANLVGAVTKDLVDRGISARDLLAPGAQLLGGGAGGKPDLAIPGGPAADRLQDALDAVAQKARDALGG
jgi:alanyl-tRNA synthetase